MSKIKSLFSNTLILILLLVLGVSVALFLNSQTQQPTAKQEPKVTQKPQATIAPTKPTNTPEPTRIITVIPVVVTIFPTPTPAPSSTPTPTFEPLSDKPIMGFVFKPPQEVPNTRRADGFDIVDWLPGSSKEVLLKGAKTLETVDVLSGTTKLYAMVNARGNIYQPIWLPEVQGVAYLSSDDQTNKTNLWLGKAGSKPEVLLSDVKAPLIPVEKGRGVAVYYKNDQAMKAVSPNKQNLKPVPQPVTVPLPQLPAGKLINTAYQPGGDWIAYYNVDGFQLVNSKSGETRPIDLGGDQFVPLWTMEAKWSPDGQRLALIVTEDRSLIHFSDLYILEWPVATLRKVDDTFSFITDIAWAPDNKHLLLKAVIDQKDGMDINALYITDISTPSEILPVPIPIDGLGSSFGGGLTWATDGSKILVKYFNDSGGALYQIEVITR